MVMLFLPSVGILEMFESELHTLQLKVFFSLFLYQKSWQFFLKKQKKIEFTLEKYEI